MEEHKSRGDLRGLEKLAVKIEEEVPGNTKWRITKEEPFEDEVSLRNEGCLESQEISVSKMGRRLLDKNFLVVQGVLSASKASHAGRLNREGRDEATAKNESHQVRDKENQSERKNGLEQQLVGQ